MKTYYLIPVRSVPRFELHQNAIERVEGCTKSQAERLANGLESKLNGGRTQDDIWAAYQTGDFSVNPCEAWRVDVSTFAQAADWGSFSQWPCNKEL